jgi:hypothetical protein
MKTFTLIFCLVIALAAFWYGIKLIRLYLRVKKWDRVKAIITQRSVVERKQTSASRAGFKPSIDYSYTYNSKTYTGNRIFLVELIKGERGFLKHAAEKFLLKIPNEINIHVNPKDPEEAVMFCEGIWLYVFVLIMGLVSLLIGIGNYFS